MPRVQGLLEGSFPGEGSPRPPMNNACKRSTALEPSGQLLQLCTQSKTQRALTNVLVTHAVTVTRVWLPTAPRMQHLGWMPEKEEKPAEAFPKVSLFRCCQRHVDLTSWVGAPACALLKAPALWSVLGCPSSSGLPCWAERTRELIALLLNTSPGNETALWKTSKYWFGRWDWNCLKGLFFPDKECN